MPLPTALPYGIRDIKITPYTDAAAKTLAATSIDLPNARTLSFSETEEFTELRGDDEVATTRGQGPSVEWELESGGLDFAACKAMQGGTITETGITPAIKVTWAKKTTDSRPFFKLTGKAISDSGGHVNCVLDRCRSTGNFEGEFADGEFFLTSGSGVALGSKITGREGTVYEFEQLETADTTT